MLCSEAELGLSEDGDGILVLPPGLASPGAPLTKVLPGARDTILELGVTPNRPDALGHLGLAREAAALFDLPFGRFEDGRSVEEPERVRQDDVARYAAITIDDGDRCPHYGAAVVLDVKIGPSPFEVRWRLASLGVRPISNVVDVTNLVMLEFGHPLHAFDLDRVRGRAIRVRRAAAGEKLKTLDGVDRVLDEDDLLVCDGEGPVALAGVMGGGDSEIHPETRRVLLECAYFDARSVRRSSRRHGLHTEASHRFERGVDWDDTRAALARASSLVARLAEGTAVQPTKVVEAKPLARRTVSVRAERVDALLGSPVDPVEARGILERLGFVTRASQADGVELWEVPSHRPDVAREVDLIEEVARVRGFDLIPTTLPNVRPSRDAAPRERMARRAREAGLALGLSEAITYAFVAPADLEALGAPAPAVFLRNPMSAEQSVMRTSLLPGLLRAVGHARRHGEPDARLFTVGPVFGPRRARDDEREETPADALPEERLGFAALLVGHRDGWLSPPQGVDVWDAKGLADAFVQRVLRRPVALVAAPENLRPRALHPRGAAFIEVAGKRVGVLGPLHPEVAETFDVGERAIAVELDLEALDAVGAQPARFASLPRFPASTRDLAVVVRDDVPAGEVEHAARDAAGDLAEEVRLFDRFVGGSVPAGHASLALHVVYRAADRTLTDADVDARHAQVLAAVEKRFGASLRGAP
jgi:phenylalanyl-tRNA synthetase beta chain